MSTRPEIHRFCQSISGNQDACGLATEAPHAKAERISYSRVYPYRGEAFVAVQPVRLLATNRGEENARNTPLPHADFKSVEGLSSSVV